MSALRGYPVWIDLMTSDVEGAKTFYPDLFGWTAGESDPDFGGYFMFFLDGKPVAGGMPKQDPNMPDVWSIYLHTEDIAATTAKVVPAGGQVMIEPMQVGDLGWMGGYLAPDGAFIGAWQPLSFAGGEGQGVGAPGWYECLSRDFRPSVSFYEDVFGWETTVMSDTDDFRYTQLGADADARAGIMDAASWLPEGVPSHWAFYVNVEDADAVIAKATSLGASLMNGPDDTPYGRLAILTDSSGALFKVIQANPPSADA